ncbi:glycosyltransferase [Pedobacter sp. PF22-3]|uniref:glycosyltransferase n=1 Tax=Pedobacter sp. PF22-3 TaxID=2994467 RepID=UPI00224701F7|nr:glycosyltransferase family 2 protein [Pedobacter sp. PF22-3]MCX2492575.1 glycosyltransferase [Pedobacter sp. PF22-3]
MKFISVVIPTYNRAKFIGLTLESFAKQDYPEDFFEIIVINNNSTDNTVSVVNKMICKYPLIRYFEEPRQGVHFARNSAIKYAKGDILYYTDDDMIADRNLLKIITSTFDLDPKIAAVSGRVLPKWETDPPPWIKKYCSNGLLSLNFDETPINISNELIAIYSCSQAMLKSAFLQSGGFNPENTMGDWIGDGETGLALKLLDLGYKLAYNGNAIIYHVIPKSRTTQSYLNKRYANQANCDSYTMYRAQNGLTNKQLKKQILSSFKLLVYKVISAFLNFLTSRDIWRVHLAQIFYCRNRIIYDYKLINDEKWRQLVLRRNWFD